MSIWEERANNQSKGHLEALNGEKATLNCTSENCPSFYELHPFDNFPPQPPHPEPMINVGHGIEPEPREGASPTPAPIHPSAPVRHIPPQRTFPDDAAPDSGCTRSFSPYCQGSRRTLRSHSASKMCASTIPTPSAIVSCLPSLSKGVQRDPAGRRGGREDARGPPCHSKQQRGNANPKASHADRHAAGYGPNS